MSDKCNRERRSRAPLSASILAERQKAFICKAQEIHNGRYNYSLVKYKGSKTNVEIICPDHGVFQQTPNNHLRQACPICAGRGKMTTQRFIQISMQKHGSNQYDYSKVSCSSNTDEVIIGCSTHGWFKQQVRKHLLGHGCPLCNQPRKPTTSEFIQKIAKVHGNKYDYSLVKYETSNHPVAIICNLHGVFYASPDNLYAGKGCPICKESNLERELANMLNHIGAKYERQKRFDWLRYKQPQSLDFYLPDIKVAIECQGRQHYVPIDFFGGEKSFSDSVARDVNKQKLCEAHEISVIYFTSPKIYELCNIDNGNCVVCSLETLQSIIKNKYGDKGLSLCS